MAEVDDGRALSLAGIAVGLLALLSVPWLLGPVGIGLGYLGTREGDPLGRTAVRVATFGLLAGLVLSFLAFHALRG